MTVQKHYRTRALEVRRAAQARLRELRAQRTGNPEARADATGTPKVAPTVRPLAFAVSDEAMSVANAPGPTGQPETLAGAPRGLPDGMAAPGAASQVPGDALCENPSAHVDSAAEAEGSDLDTSRRDPGRDGPDQDDMALSGGVAPADFHKDEIDAEAPEIASDGWMPMEDVAGISSEPPDVAGSPDEGDAAGHAGADNAGRLPIEEADAGDAPPETGPADGMTPADTETAAPGASEAYAEPGVAEGWSARGHSDLTRLPGAGEGLIWLLRREGIATLSDLAEADADRLSERLDLIGQLIDIRGWIDFARQQDAAGTSPAPAEAGETAV